MNFKQNRKVTSIPTTYYKHNSKKMWFRLRPNKISEDYPYCLAVSEDDHFFNWGDGFTNYYVGSRPIFYRAGYTQISEEEFNKAFSRVTKAMLHSEIY